MTIATDKNTGRFINELLIIGVDLERTKNTGRTYYYCLCSCLKYKSIRSDGVLNGHSKSCGHLKNSVWKTTDYSGQKIGALTVLSKTGEINPNEGPYYLCKCDCSKEDIRTHRDLKDGERDKKHLRCKACQIINQQKSLLTDLSGQIIGTKKVINYDFNIKRWNCECIKCQRKSQVRSSHLKKEECVICVCSRKNSYKEQYITNVLNDLDLTFSEQLTFSGLKGSGGGSLKYDFGVFDDNQNLLFLLEYDGEQHFKSIEHWGGEEGFKKRQLHDSLKNQYCSDNNIKLYRIAYTQNLEQELKIILLKEKLISPDFSF